MISSCGPQSLKLRLIARLGAGLGGRGISRCPLLCEELINPKSHNSTPNLDAFPPPNLPPVGYPAAELAFLQHTTADSAEGQQGS